MVLMEDSKEKLSMVLDRDPEGLSNIVESSDILEASHIREVSDTQTPAPVCEAGKLAEIIFWDAKHLSVFFEQSSLNDFSGNTMIWVNDNQHEYVKSYFDCWFSQLFQS